MQEGLGSGRRENCNILRAQLSCVGERKRWISRCCVSMVQPHLRNNLEEKIQENRYTIITIRKQIIHIEREQKEIDLMLFAMISTVLILAGMYTTREPDYRLETVSGYDYR